MDTDASTNALRVIAVDWSGRKDGGERTIWLAEVVGGELVRLENGRSRNKLVAHLAELLCEGPPSVVGLDFAFSMPAWFVQAQGARDGVAFWDVVARDAERWLSSCKPPFWGRAGTRKTHGDSDCLRATDIDCAHRGFGRPKAVFQVGGAGAVGTGSLRGMPALRTLHDAGYGVWPFCPPGRHTIIEIYPRAFTGPVVKSDRGAREAHLAAHFPALGNGFREEAARSEDAFDAAVSALRMWEHRDELTSLQPLVGERARLEGAIWLPAGAPWWSEIQR